MSTRIIALTILGLIMGFIVLMASVTFFVREPLPIVGANQTLLLHTTEITPQIRTSLAIDGGFKVDLTVEHSAAQTPLVELRPTGGKPIPLDRGPDSSGAPSASGQFTRTGRWEVVLRSESVTEILPFILRE